MNQLFSILDVNGIIKFASPSHESILGYPPETYMGRLFFELLSLDEQEPVRNMFQEIIMNHSPRTVPFRLQHHLKGWVAVKATGIPILAENGKVDYVVVLTTIDSDVPASDRPDFETPAFMPDAMFTIGLDGTIDSVNTAAHTVMGYEREELYGRHLEQLFASKDKSQINSLLESVRQGESLKGEFVLNHKDGSPIEVSLTLIPLVRGHMIEGIYGVAKDISEGKRFEQALLYSREKFQMVFNYTSNMIFLMKWESAGSIRVLEVNEVAKKTLRFESEVLEGINFMELIAAKEQEKVNCHLKKLLWKEAVAFITHFIVKQRNSLIPVELNARRVHLENEELVIVFARDTRGEGERENLLDWGTDRGRSLRIVMAEKDIHVSELAHLTGLSVVTISNLRTGKIAKPHLSTARLIADALGVNPKDLWPNIKR